MLRAFFGRSIGIALHRSPGHAPGPIFASSPNRLETLSLSVEAARTAILSKVPADHATESVALADALGRTLAIDLSALVTQPPIAVSAMDGYAVRAADVAGPSVALRIVGESAAGSGFHGARGPGECVRIFTGAPVPEGADAVLVQEEARAEDGSVRPIRRVDPGCFIRPKGLDFAQGDCLLSEGNG